MTERVKIKIYKMTVKPVAVYDSENVKEDIRTRGRTRNF
jgi:hypothetical protein